MFNFKLPFFFIIYYPFIILVFITKNTIDLAREKKAKNYKFIIHHELLALNVFRTNLMM
jgi:uncharacterized membrane protein